MYLFEFEVVIKEMEEFVSEAKKVKEVLDVQWWKIFQAEHYRKMTEYRKGIK
jgi:hypothetical protein